MEGCYSFRVFNASHFDLRSTAAEVGVCEAEMFFFGLIPDCCCKARGHESLLENTHKGGL
jgi:hypothetical protein